MMEAQENLIQPKYGLEKEDSFLPLGLLIKMVRDRGLLELFLDELVFLGLPLYARFVNKALIEENSSSIGVLDGYYPLQLYTEDKDYDYNYLVMQKRIEVFSALSIPYQSPYNKKIDDYAYHWLDSFGIVDEVTDTLYPLVIDPLDKKCVCITANTLKQIQAKLALGLAPIDATKLLADYKNNEPTKVEVAHNRLEVVNNISIVTVNYQQTAPEKDVPAAKEGNIEKHDQDTSVVESTTEVPFEEKDIKPPAKTKNRDTPAYSFIKCALNEYKKQNSNGLPLSYEELLVFCRGKHLGGGYKIREKDETIFLYPEDKSGVHNKTLKRQFNEAIKNIR